MKKILLVYLLLLIGIFLFSDTMDNYNQTSNLKREIKNDYKIDSTTNYIYYSYIDNKIVKLKFLISDLFESISEIKKIESYDHKEKDYLFFKYYNIDSEKNIDQANDLFWNNFYKEIYHLNFSRVDDIILYFNKQKENNNWTKDELFFQAVKFVQYINFKRPFRSYADFNSTTAYTFDFYTPNEMFLYELGDCDTKTLLLILILNRLGFDAVLFQANAYNHVMAGVNFECNGKYKEYEGKKYYFVETTLRDFKPGKIIAGWGNLSKWRVVPVR